MAEKTSQELLEELEKLTRERKAQEREMRKEIAKVKRKERAIVNEQIASLVRSILGDFDSFSAYEVLLTPALKQVAEKQNRKAGKESKNQES